MLGCTMRGIMKRSWFIYMLQCSDQTFYIGITNNLSARLKVHNLGRGAKYTRGRRPLKLVWKEPAKNISLALKREHKLKRLTRREKIKLINIK